MKRPLPLFVASCLLVLASMPAKAHEPESPTVAGVVEAAPGGLIAPAGISGFSPDSVLAQLAREARAARVIRPDSLRRHLRLLTEEPHVAGTPADKATAEYMRQRLQTYGWDARVVEIPVWLNYPKVSELELVEPVHEPLAVRESGIPGDKDATNAAVFDAFHGYSASGEVTAQVVYANYGDIDDFKALTKLGIELRGRIALVRDGKVFRGLKVRNAERFGLAGVLIYSDPADDGYAQADPYPRGQGRPADAIQRGSVQSLNAGPGDPSTPGWPSTASGKRLKAADMTGVPRIPSLPMSYGEAQRILQRLDGPQAPKGWQGGLPFTYHVGPGGAKVRMKSVQDYAVRPIWNVIATLAGRESPQQKVVLGNHRDAWTYGALDPNSGTVCMLELARGLGELARTGWRPRRSIVLCSWDGEEYGLLGSTEWAEANAADLTLNAVAYVNVDGAVSGRDLRIGGCHALGGMVAEAMRDVRDPRQNRSLWNVTVDQAWADGRSSWASSNRMRRLRGEPPRAFEWRPSALGSGSDYTVFVDHLGVPSLDMAFAGLHGNYHSMYDDFEFADRVVDPGFVYHATMTELWERVALRLAEAEVLPLRYTDTALFALDEIQSLEERADDWSAGKADSLRFTATTVTTRAAVARLRNAALELERRTDAALEGRGPWPTGGVASVNTALIGAERALLGSGLPGREWFRHEVYAPGLDTGYGAVSLPRMGEALLEGDSKAWARGLGPILQAFDRAAAVLDRVR